MARITKAQTALTPQEKKALARILKKARAAKALKAQKLSKNGKNRPKS